VNPPTQPPQVFVTHKFISNRIARRLLEDHGKEVASPSEGLQFIAVQVLEPFMLGLVDQAANGPRGFAGDWIAVDPFGRLRIVANASMEQWASLWPLTPCARCGIEIAKSATFCTHCGSGQPR
jgi:hypothetical protein